VLSAAYNLDHTAIATVIEMLLRHESLALQDPDVIAAALDHYRRKPTLGFSDCLILEIANKTGHLPLGTFDKTLGKLTGAQKL
jgi:predicted nucleic-acid-binding protein